MTMGRVSGPRLPSGHCLGLFDFPIPLSMQLAELVDLS